MSSRTTASAIARAVRTHDLQAEIEARREHAATKIENHIAAVVATAPPLTCQQAERITTALREAMSER